MNAEAFSQFFGGHQNCENEVDTSWTVHIYSISLFNTNFNGNPNLNANVIQPVKGYIKYEPKMMSDEDVLEYTVQ